MKRFAIPLLLVNSLALGTESSSVSLAWEGNPRTIDPRFAIDANSQYLADLVHCSLISFDPDGNIVGQAAESWQWKDAKTLDVIMKPDLRFHDGSPVKAEDVQATYQFFQNPGVKRPSPLAGSFKNLSKVEVVSPKTLRFTLNEADVTFLANLMVGILPKTQAQQEVFEDPGKMKSCGPFILSKVGIYDYTLVRNENFSLGPKAILQEVIIKIVKDDATRFAKLLKGEVELVANGISRDKLKNFEKEYPGLSLTERPGLNVSYLGFNFRDKTLQDKRVRKAIASAINRDELIRHILQGMAQSSKNFLTQGSPFYNEEIVSPSYNRELAKKLLDEAGFPVPDGKGHQSRFRLSLKTTNDLTKTNIAQVIAGQLKQVGIDVEVQSLEWGKFKDDVEKGAAQMWLLNWIGYKDPDIFRYTFSTDNFPPNGGNRGWYSNPQLDPLLTEAHKTSDFKKRKALYDQVQKIVAEELPYVFLWHEKNFAIYRNSLKGFQLYADGRLSALKNVLKN